MPERDRPANKDEAIELLAKHLHWTMERFDPTEPEYTWDKLAPFEQEFRRACVRELLINSDWIEVALQPNSLRPTTT
jgi:hypothetical protein